MSLTETLDGSILSEFSSEAEKVMRPTIYLALTHDWELRGNGSGDIERIQFAPLRELLGIYHRYGVRSTFQAELMQQLTFRKFEAQHTELKTLADRWDEHAREAFRQGHDIQLHIHPQWLGARYDDGQWRLHGDWSLLNYDPETAYSMLTAGKEYLEALLRPLDPSYKCLAFRAGALAVAPSPDLLKLLVKLGIVLDVSLAGGLHLDTRNIQLDYRNCEESFLPFYPRMEDARKVSSKTEEIVCVPINHFYGSRRQVFRQHLQLVWRKLRRHLFSVSANESDAFVEAYGRLEWAQKNHSSTLVLLYEKGIVPYLRGKYLVSDTARLDYPLLREMLTSIRRRALTAGRREIPVVLTNHPKDIKDFASIERFIRDAARSDDIRFITLTELARKLQREEFQVRKAAAQAGRSG